MIAFEGDAGQEGDDIGLVSRQEVHEFGGRRSRGPGASAAGTARLLTPKASCMTRRCLRHRTTLVRVLSNALEPGWVPTKMGGTGAPDDMDQAHLTQAWLAAGDDPKAQITGNYFYHLKRKTPNPEANDPAVQEPSSISALGYPASFCQLETVRMRSAVGGREEPKPANAEQWII